MNTSPREEATPCLLGGSGTVWLRVTPSQPSGARPPAGEGTGGLLGGEAVRADGSSFPWGPGSGDRAGRWPSFRLVFLDRELPHGQ